MKRNYINRFIIAGILLGIILLFRYLKLDEYITLVRMQYYADQLKHFTQQNYLISVFCFLMIMIGATLGSIPITVVLTIVGGFLYGVWHGTVYAIIGATLGGLIIVAVIRYALGDYLQDRYKKQLEEFNQEIEQYGYQYLFIIQLLPFTPTFMLNVLTGLTTIPLWTFIWTAIVGMFPGAFIYAWAGQQIYLLETVRDIVVPWMVIVTILLVIFGLMLFSWGRYPFFMARLYKKRKKRE